MKKKRITVILFIVFFAGLSLVLYPSFSDYWNSFTQSKAIVNYTEIVADLDEDRYQEMWEAAAAYNQSLIGRANPYLLSDVQRSQYNELLNLTGTGVMAYVEIPAIGVSLPIYHGISDEVLKFAIGHLDWSSLPVGGAGTHCVVSGHRGLPSAKLFTDLDEIVEGDIFVLRVLDSILTYEVDRISIVEPTDTAQLLIEEGSDYCTLVTCTPYGINSHRLLIRGHRIENQAQSRTVRVVSEAIQIDPMVVAPIVLIPILFVSIILLLLADKADARQRGGESDEEEI